MTKTQLKQIIREVISENTILNVGDIIDFKNSYGLGNRSKILRIDSHNRILVKQLNDGSNIILNPTKVIITVVKSK